MTPTLVKIGLFEIAFAALLGWALIAHREKPGSLKRIGVIAPRRILQCHLDQIMMGLILIAAALALAQLALPQRIDVGVDVAEAGRFSSSRRAEIDHPAAGDGCP